MPSATGSSWKCQPSSSFRTVHPPGADCHGWRAIHASSPSCPLALSEKFAGFGFGHGRQEGPPQIFPARAGGSRPTAPPARPARRLLGRSGQSARRADTVRRGRSGAGNADHIARRPIAQQPGAVARLPLFEPAGVHHRGSRRRRRRTASISLWLASIRVRVSVISARLAATNAREVSRMMLVWVCASRTSLRSRAASLASCV
jgi:hypothetical protein